MRKCEPFVIDTCSYLYDLFMGHGGQWPQDAIVEFDEAVFMFIVFLPFGWRACVLAKCKVKHSWHSTSQFSTA